MIKRYALKYNKTGKYYAPSFGEIENRFKSDLTTCKLLEHREACDNLIRFFSEGFSVEQTDFAIVTVELLVKEKL